MISSTQIWRTVLWYPELVSHVFSVCTAYSPPFKRFISTEQLVEGPAPFFGYQIHLASGEVEKRIQSRHDIRQFIKGMFGGRGPNKELIFDPFKGIVFEHLSKVGDSPLLTEKVLLSLIVDRLTKLTDARNLTTIPISMHVTVFMGL
jgi:soluble epoxide hydrolase/lipid-phosphate phosphatase